MKAAKVTASSTRAGLESAVWECRNRSSSPLSPSPQSVARLSSFYQSYPSPKSQKRFFYQRKRLVEAYSSTSVPAAGETKGEREPTES